LFVGSTLFLGGIASACDAKPQQAKPEQYDACRFRRGYGIVHGIGYGITTTTITVGAGIFAGDFNYDFSM
jgi:hypothetical protein